jgi:hypothetical protein
LVTGWPSREFRFSSFQTLRAAPWTAAARRRFGIWQVGITLVGRESRALHQAVISKGRKKAASSRRSPRRYALPAVFPTCHLRPTTYEHGPRGGKLPIDDFRLPISDWRFFSFSFRASPAAILFILSLETVDNRSGEVWTARVIVSVRDGPSFRVRVFHLLVTSHEPLTTALSTSDSGPPTSDRVSRHSPLGPNH